MSIYKCVIRDLKNEKQVSSHKIQNGKIKAKCNENAVDSNSQQIHNHDPQNTEPNKPYKKIRNQTKRTHGDNTADNTYATS
jgi:hypothetical protein